MRISDNSGAKAHPSAGRQNLPRSGRGKAVQETQPDIAHFAPRARSVHNRPIAIVAKSHDLALRELGGQVVAQPEETVSRGICPGGQRVPA